MAKPRDHYHIDRVGAVRLARFFSDIASPPVMFAVLGLSLSWYELPFWPGLLWAAVYGFFVSLTPILFVLYLLRTGRIAELHMTNTQERHLPYLVAVVSSIFVLGLIFLLKGPSLLHCLSLLNITVLLFLGFINSRWLISFHTTAAAAMMTVVGLVFSPLVGAALVPFVGLVIMVRLYLRRHTVAQVVAGLFLGILSVLGLATTGCFTL